MLKAGKYKSAANRAYYAAFHAMRSVLALEGIDMKHHSGIMSEFRRIFIKTGIMPTSISDNISRLFRIRSDCDYDDFFELTQKEAEAQIKDANMVLQSINDYLNNTLFIRKDH